MNESCNVGSLTSDVNKKFTYLLYSYLPCCRCDLTRFYIGILVGVIAFVKVRN